MYLDGDCDIAVGIWELGKPSSIIPKLEVMNTLMDNVLHNSPFEAAMLHGLIIKRKKEKQTQGDTSSTRRGKTVEEGKNVGTDSIFHYIEY